MKFVTPEAEIPQTQTGIIYTNISNKLNDTQDSLTQPQVLKNLSSFSAAIERYDIDPNIIQFMQEIASMGRLGAGIERDREIALFSSMVLLRENERRMEATRELISHLRLLERELNGGSEERISEASERVRADLGEFLKEDVCREKLVLDKVEELTKRMAERERLERELAAEGKVGRAKESAEEKERRKEEIAAAVRQTEEEIRKIKKGLISEIERLRKEWEDHLKALKRMEEEKDPQKKKTLRERLEREFEKLLKKTREKIEKLYEELYGRKMRLLEEALKRIDGLIREGAGREKREREVLGILKGDRELHDVVAAMLPGIRSTRELGDAIRSLLNSLIRDPIRCLLEKLLGCLRMARPDPRKVLELLTIIARFGRAKALLRKLSNQLKSGAPRGRIEATLEEIRELMPLTELGENIKRLLEEADELKFRKGCVSLLGRLEEGEWAISTIGYASKTRDPETVRRTAAMLGEMYGKLIPEIRRRAAEIYRKGEGRDAKLTAEVVSRMIREEIARFRRESGI